MTSQKKINLLKGSPGPDLVPASLLKDAAQAALSQSDVGLERGPLDYGSDAGYEPLRASIASWLKTFYSPQHSITDDRICISGGASQNLACILQVFTDIAVTQGIWFVEPVYYLALRIFEDAGFHSKLRAVPDSEHGIDVKSFDRMLSSVKNQDLRPTKPLRPTCKFYKHVLYCVPTFSNPSGKTMPLATREALVRLARAHDVLVISDDVYDFLQWPSMPPSTSPLAWRSYVPRLVDIDARLDGGPKDSFGNTVSNGSFSKIIAPGVRVGWAEGTERFAEGLSQAGSSHSGGAPSQMTSTFVHRMIVSGSLHAHITTHLVKAYAQRYSTTISAIRKHLGPCGVQIEEPSKSIPVSGGYFVWVKLPNGLIASEVTARARQAANLVVAGGTMFAGPHKEGAYCTLESYLRICFAWEADATIREGIERLASVLESFSR